MEIEIVKRLTPEEEELAAKRKELARLEAQLADEELALASLKAEQAAFEGLYLRRVGVLYAELDDWKAQLAELMAERAPTPDANSDAAAARAQARESYSAAHGEGAEVKPFAPSADLRKLYREAAKRVHPDTAIDDEDRARRERWMKDVNIAYAKGDEDALRSILANIDNSPEAVQGLGVAADLIRVLRQLRLVRSRLAAIEAEIAALAQTDIAMIKTKADIGASQGLDLLAEMEMDIRGRIRAVRQIFDQATDGEARA